MAVTGGASPSYRKVYVAGRCRIDIVSGWAVVLDHSAHVLERRVELREDRRSGSTSGAGAQTFSRASGKLGTVR